MEVDVLDVVPVDENRSLLWIVKALHQIDERRLAGARGPDDGDLFSGTNRQIQIFQDPLFRLVAEPYVFKTHFASQALQNDRTGRCHDPVVVVEKAEDPLRRRETELELTDGARKIVDRRGQKAQRPEKGDQFAG